MSLINVGAPQIVNRGIGQIMIEAGLADLIEALVTVGTNERSLLEHIMEELEYAFQYYEDAMAGRTPKVWPRPEINLEVFSEVLAIESPGNIYEAINTDLLRYLLKYLDDKADAQVKTVSALPPLAPIDGPKEVFAGRNINKPEEVNITFTAPPEEYTYEIYLDLRYVKSGSLKDSGDGYVYETLSVPKDDQQHTVRVVYVTPEKNIGRFSTAVAFGEKPLTPPIIRDL